MSSYRIDPTRIIYPEDGPEWRTGRGTVVIGELAPAVESTPPDPRQTVAVKKLTVESTYESDVVLKSFADELSLMTTLSHPNIVKLIGFVEDIQNRDARLVLHWEGNGNIRDFLRSGEWDIPERVSLIQDTASGLEYLHTRQPPIRHGDLRSTHILVNASYRAVITGFGKARTTAERWPGRSIGRIARLGDTWYPNQQASPALLNGELWDLPEDMWAMGWVCWEIVTGRIPFEHAKDVAAIVYVMQGDLPAIREHAQLGQVIQLCDLISYCWKMDPAKRIGVSTFRKKTCFVPSTNPAPSGYTTGGLKIRSATLLLELGRMYDLQNDTVAAVSQYHSAIDVATLDGNRTVQANALIGLGDTYNTWSMYSEAEEAFLKARGIHYHIGDDLGVANALIGLGEVYCSRCRYSEAQEAFRRALEIYSSIGNDRGVADASVGLGDTYTAQSRYSEAEEVFTSAHKIHDRIGNDRGVADAHVGLGDTYFAHSRYSEAETAFRTAHSIYCRVGNDLGAANALTGLGEVSYSRCRYSEAQEAFMGAHEIYSGIGNDRGVADALVGLGDTYNAQSRYSEAEEVFRSAHKIHYRIGNDSGVADAYVGLGDTYYARSMYSEAEGAFREARKIHSRVGGDLGPANALIGLGKVYYCQSRYSKAEDALKRTLDILSRICDNVRVANALIGLGEVYSVHSRYREAEQAFKDGHQIHSCLGNDCGAANASVGLGRIYNAWSRYSEAEEVFTEAHEIHSRIGNNFGVANALIGLGEVYSVHSRYREAEQAFKDGHQIHSCIGNDRGAANASVGLGRIYDAWSRYSDAEEVFKEAHEIHSRIGNNVEVAGALIGLAEAYTFQSRYSEAEEAFMNAHEIHSHVGNDVGVANVLIGLGEIYGAQSRYPEAEKAFTGAHQIYIRIGNYVRAANAVFSLGEIYDTQSKSVEAEEAFNKVPGIVSRIGIKLTGANPLNDLGESYDAHSEASAGEEHFRETPETRFCVDTYIGASGASGDSADIKFDAQAVDSTDEESLEEASSVHSFIHSDSRSASMVYNPEQASPIQELSSIKSISMPSTQYIVDLILALAKTTPTTIRNKHQLYRILIISRDLCYHLHRVAHAGDDSSSGISVLERCWEVMDNLERALLELNEIVSQETVPFGALSLATWNNSRTRLGRIYEKLTGLLFNYAQTYDVDDSANATWDRYSDDCSWMSLLLLEGIELPVQNMHGEAEKGFSIEVQNLIDRLNYLVNETKLNGNTNEPSRELFIKILSDLASVMLNGPDTLPVDFWNMADRTLQPIDLEKNLNQELVGSLRDSWSGFMERQTPHASTLRSPTRAPTQNPIAVSLPQELTHLEHEITPATEPLVLLLHSLGRSAPMATRNKHKICTIVSRARDICNHILAIGARPDVGGLGALDEYYDLIDAIEGILLDVTRLLPPEQVSFGREMCESWPKSQEEFSKILNRLHEPPFCLELDPSAPEQELTNNSVFDDHFWLSLLLEEGIEKELGRQYLDIEMPPAVASVREGLRYLENEIKCGYHEETTRNLVIDIATRLYEVLSASVSEKGSNAGLPIRLAEPLSPITLDKEMLVTALSITFSVLDLDSSLEPQDIHRLAGSWWGISHSSPTRHSGNLGESEPSEVGSSRQVEPMGQEDPVTSQDPTKSQDYWLHLHQIISRRNLAYSEEMVPRDNVREENWIVTIHITGEDLDTLRLTGTGVSKREAKEAVARLALIIFGEIVGEE